MGYDLKITSISGWAGEYNGGFNIHWHGQKDGKFLDFGVVAVHQDDDGKINIDTEYMGEEFVEALLKQLLTQAVRR